MKGAKESYIFKFRITLSKAYQLTKLNFILRQNFFLSFQLYENVNLNNFVQVTLLNLIIQFFIKNYC